MKLLHAISSMDPRTGGPSQAIRNLALPTQTLGHTMEVVCLDDPQSDFIAKDNFTIHALGRGGGPWGYNRSLRPWFQANLSRYDAVVLNGQWQYIGHSLAAAARQPKAPPYFIFPHGALDPWFQRAPERRMKAIRNWIYWKLVEQNVVHGARAMLFTCAEEMRLARDTFRPYHPQMQLDVGFGISRPPAFQPRMDNAFFERCPELNGRPYFLFLARINRKKGVHLLIQAYATLCQTCLQSGTSNVPALVIAGPGLETDYGRNVFEMARQACPTGSVLWPGMLTGDAKWGAIYRSTAFVLTSHQENFGIAVVEALACGRPVLISNQINIWREIEQDQAGLVETDTVAGSENLFLRWQQLSADQKIAMAHSAKACFEQRFDVAFSARNLMAKLEQLTLPCARH